MAEKAKSPYVFQSGFVESRNVARVIAQAKALNDLNAGVSSTLKWTRENGQWSAFDLKWIATRMCALTGPPAQFYAVGPWGDVVAAVPGRFGEEKVDESDQGPLKRGQLRDLRWIGGHLYAAGMGRQVYRRMGDAKWERRDEGVVVPLGKQEVLGFNSIDGLSEDDLTAVGFEGEIWRCRKGRWEQVDSPTNVVLHRVRVIEPDLAYACGQKGVVLRGRGDRWDVVEHGLAIADLWGMEWYRERLWVAGDIGLWRLASNDTLEDVPIVPGERTTSRHLHANDGMMWSFGENDLYWTEDGATWHDATPRAKS